MKTCSHCHETKETSAFYRCKQTKDGLHSWCKSCISAHQSAYRATNDAVIKQRKKEYRERNRERMAAKDKAYYEANKEKHNARSAAWYEANKAKALETAAEWSRQNPEKRKAAQRKYRETSKHVRQAEYERNKPQYFDRAAQRRVTQKQATPTWSNREVVLEYYRAVRAFNRNKAFGGEWHVDHIVPLNHPLVCGLHCHTNLQMLPAAENMSKGNRSWPGMPDLL